MKCKVSEIVTLNEVTAKRMEWAAKRNEAVCRFKMREFEELIQFGCLNYVCYMTRTSRLRTFQLRKLMTGCDVIRTETSGALMNIQIKLGLNKRRGVS